MIKSKYIYSFIIVLAIFLSGANCKKKKTEIQHKYPEDPGTTTKTPRERLHSSWRVYAYEFNGVNVIGNIDTVNNSEARIEDVNINYDYWEDYKNWLFLVYNPYFNFESATAFNVDDPYYIVFSGGANVLFSKWFITPFRWTPSNANITTKWTISKLYDTDLNLTLNTDSGEYKMLLRKKN